MRKEFENWIVKNVPAYEDAYGKCAEVSKAMASEFPELVIVKGFVHTVFWGAREHWWLKDKNGNIVDPTKKQFPGILEYEELDKDHPAMNFPRQRCPNCGEYFYSGRWGTCSSECGIEFDKYLNG